jgi:hypothetical protein
MTSSMLSGIAVRDNRDCSPITRTGKRSGRDTDWASVGKLLVMRVNITVLQVGDFQQVCATIIGLSGRISQ